MADVGPRVDEPSTRQAPAGFTKTELTRTLLDITYWVNRAMPREPMPGKVWPLGVPAASRGPHIQPNRRKGKPPEPPSVSAAVAELTNACTFAAELPFVSMSSPAAVDPLMASVISQSVRGVATLPTHPPASIPVSGALHECTQLVWDDPKHLCASGADCVAALLSSAPGPLPFYTAPGQERAKMEQPAFCLLCIRTDAASVCSVASKLAVTSEHQFGMVPVVLPPFQNLVSCADGYYPETLGVTPPQDVFSPISIVGPNAPIDVEYDAVKEVWYIDQSRAIWRPNGRYLNGPVPAATPASGWHNLQQPLGSMPNTLSQ